MKFYRLFRSLSMAALLVMAVPVNAAGSHSADKWQFGADVYLWGSSIDVTPTGGDNTHISFDDLLDNLDMAMMTALSARKGKWSLLADFIYLDVEDDIKGSTKLLDIIPVPADIDVELKAWVITTVGGYTIIEEDNYSLDLLAGARYLWIELPLELQVGPIRRKASPSGDIWDGVVGVRGKVDVSNDWYISYYLDAGAGDSQFTWQALWGLNYKFKKVDAIVGYRYLDWDIDGNSIDDLTLKGPFAGVKFSF